MDKDLNQCEQLSALMDGELEGEALAEALRLAHGEGSQATWELYHLVGDVLRSPELAAHASSPLLGRLREQLAQEPAAARVPLVLQSESPVVSVHVPQPAANASVFRWKMVAGIASMAAVAAIGWNSVEALRGGGAQLASAPVVSPASVVAVSEGAGQPVMLRDPRLDELLQAHKQFGSTSALQMPAGFLRNATFEEPSR
ncbi:RseA-like anti sigma(E) protein [Acidovorax sp. 56]|uniref:sigma-E factor negative regulatory protein n=1 Tax=Acidovorax sp. 56 TaxID=2035205 RepID=UPI000C1734A5|nr:RseA family anti-sigma factor [Acidovorax sp. 56]PIF29173.1 RseA-like anti sigma(E) protein [Acidovorax sp. 56]